MSHSEDVYENTSVKLSGVIAHVLDDEEIIQPATLDSVREAILVEVSTPTIPLNSFSPRQWQALRDEVDALIDEYGGDALAVRFLRPWASEPLQRLIEAGLDEMGEPTLEMLLQAAEAGLLARLVGKGEIDDDEAQTIIDELKELINQHGADALAETFLSAA